MCGRSICRAMGSYLAVHSQHGLMSLTRVRHGRCVLIRRRSLQLVAQLREPRIRTSLQYHLSKAFVFLYVVTSHQYTLRISDVPLDSTDHLIRSI